MDTNSQYVRAIVNTSLQGRQPVSGGPQSNGAERSLDHLATNNIDSVLLDKKGQYNNKIIINQQHYFTDSIKIYQNQKNEGNSKLA